MNGFRSGSWIGVLILFRVCNRQRELCRRKIRTGYIEMEVICLEILIISMGADEEKEYR